MSVESEVSRKEKGDLALMTCELDDEITDDVLEQIRRCEGIQTVTLMTES